MGEEKRKNGCGEEKKWAGRTEVRVRRRGKMGEEKRKNGCREEKKWVRRREIVLWGHCRQKLSRPPPPPFYFVGVKLHLSPPLPFCSPPPSFPVINDRSLTQNIECCIKRDNVNYLTLKLINQRQ